MNSNTRDERDKTYSPEAALSFKGLKTPGPGNYDSHVFTKIRHGSKDRYSIPKVRQFYSFSI